MNNSTIVNKDVATYSLVSVEDHDNNTTNNPITTTTPSVIGDAFSYHLRMFLISLLCLIFLLFLYINSSHRNTTSSPDNIISNSPTTILEDRKNINNNNNNNTQPLCLSELTSTTNFIINTQVLPVLARSLKLITVENQAQLLKWIGAHKNDNRFSFLTSDVVFLCWNEICSDPRTDDNILDPIYVSHWHSDYLEPWKLTKENKVELFDRKKDTLVSYSDTFAQKYWKIQPQIYIINELVLGLPGRTTLTQSRNRLAAFVSPQEELQGWKWAYITIMDGDGHLECPRISTVDHAIHSWMDQYKKWIIEEKEVMYEEIKCWLVFDSFLFTIGPAVGLPVFFDIHEHDDWIGGILTFHYDGVIASYHHDVFPLVHPLCEKFDAWTPWTSQAYLIIQTMCFIGNVFTNPYLEALNSEHRPYPRNSPFAPFTDEVVEQMHIIPPRLYPIRKFLQDDKGYLIHISPLSSFHHYPGFDIHTMINDDCVTHLINPQDCIQHPTIKSPRWKGEILPP